MKKDGTNDADKTVRRDLCRPVARLLRLHQLELAVFLDAATAAATTAPAPHPLPPTLPYSPQITPV